VSFGESKMDCSLAGLNTMKPNIFNERLAHNINNVSLSRSCRLTFSFVSTTGLFSVDLTSTLSGPIVRVVDYQTYPQKKWITVTWPSLVGCDIIRSATFALGIN